MSGLLPLLAAARANGLKPRVQWSPSMGGSCCVFRVDRSSRPEAESALWPNENATSDRIMQGNNHFVFIVALLGRIQGSRFVRLVKRVGRRPIPQNGPNYPSKPIASQCETGAGSGS